MSRLLKLAAAVSLLFVVSPAMSKSVQMASVRIDEPQVMPSLVEGPYTLAPMGFIRFCMESPADCALSAAAPMELTAERMAQMHAVNLSVNRRIAPKADAPGQDIWSLAVQAGDCDDYVVQKRHELAALGWPQGNMLFAAVTTPRGESHLVLVLRTDRGDFILDNLRSQIVQTAKSNYHWVKMQSARNPSYWVEARRPDLIAQVPAPRREAARPSVNPAYEVAELRGSIGLAY